MKINRRQLRRLIESTLREKFDPLDSAAHTKSAVMKVLDLVKKDGADAAYILDDYPDGGSGAFGSDGKGNFLTLHAEVGGDLAQVRKHVETVNNQMKTSLVALGGGVVVPFGFNKKGKSRRNVYQESIGIFDLAQSPEFDVASGELTGGD